MTLLSKDEMINRLVKLDLASQQEFEAKTGFSVSDIIVELAETEEIELLTEANEELSAKLNKIKELKSDPDNFIFFSTCFSLAAGGGAALIGIPSGLFLVGLGLGTGLIGLGWSERLAGMKKWIGEV